MKYTSKVIKIEYFLYLKSKMNEMNRSFDKFFQIEFTLPQQFEFYFEVLPEILRVDET